MAVYGLWLSRAGSGRILASRPLSDSLLRLTVGKTDDGLRLQAHHTAWTTSLFSGEPAAAREHSEAGCRLYDPERHRSHRLLYGGHDPGVCARYCGALAYWPLGYPDRALVIGSEALALAEHIAHPFSLQVAQTFIAMLHLDRREPEFALHLLAAAEALAAEQRLAFMMEPQFLRGAALTEQGAFEEAIACLREGLAGGRRAMLFRPYGLARLAEALSRLGQHGAALVAVRDGLQEQKETGQGRWDAHLHRIEGSALVGLNRVEEAETALQEALRVARHQLAKSYELRAATSLARLWGEQGQREEARDLLAPVYGWFTEGFDTADLKDAANLLSELS